LRFDDDLLLLGADLQLLDQRKVLLIYFINDMHEDEVRQLKVLRGRP